jgi:transposase InsO family protein
MIDQRREFVQRAVAEGANLSALCREFGITRKTGRMWRERARNEGLQALGERSRRPLHSPQRLQEEEVCHLVMLKSAWPHWGPKKLGQLFRENLGRPLSVSTCHRVLKACGLVTARKRRVRRAVSVTVAARVPREPNDVWTIDYKGWWRTADGSRCEPLTVRDAFSRYVLCAHLPANGRTEAVAAEMNRLFRRHGLPRVIKSDNGVPFASVRGPLGLTRLSAGWAALGIQLEHSRPAHPQDNGAHERLHRDIEFEVTSHRQVDVRTQQAALEVWRHEHNHVRPHESLGGRRPAELYRPSPRPFPEDRPELDYGIGYLTRMVYPAGTISYRRHLIFVSTALAGWHLGLRRRDDTTAEVWFSHLLLGELNLKTMRFGSAPSRSAKPHRLAA